MRADVPFRQHRVVAGDVEERFWARVERSGDAGCWFWTGVVWGHEGREYGQWTFHVGGGRRRTVRAHRYSWEVTNGPVPMGLEVCHHCDNPPCVNPAHLFLGTHRQNMEDKARKGRVRTSDVRGERNPHAKLTAEQVLNLRARAAAGERQCDLARAFGITPQATWNVINRRIWRHI